MYVFTIIKSFKNDLFSTNGSEVLSWKRYCGHKQRSFELKREQCKGQKISILHGKLEWNIIKIKMIEVFF